MLTHQDPGFAPGSNAIQYVFQTRMLCTDTYSARYQTFAWLLQCCNCSIWHIYTKLLTDPFYGHYDMIGLQLWSTGALPFRRMDAWMKELERTLHKACWPTAFCRSRNRVLYRKVQLTDPDHLSKTGFQRTDRDAHRMCGVPTAANSIWPHEVNGCPAATRPYLITADWDASGGGRGSYLTPNIQFR